MDCGRLETRRAGEIGSLFWTFLKIGAFTFGGGYGMLRLLEEECVEKRDWLTGEEFLNMVAMAESTPGPIAVNSATYLGYKTAGIWGAIAATIGVCLSSFVVIYLISLCLDWFLSFRYVTYAFQGIRVCVVYLILSAGIRVLKTLERTALNVTISVTVVIVLLVGSAFSVGFSSIVYILFAGTVGVAVYQIRRMRGQKK